jgi:hypothetical protein
VKLVYRLTNKELDPKIILFTIFFSNIIDLFHFDFYRTISHSLIGTLVIGCSVLFLFRLFHLIKKSEVGILLIALLTHVPADFFFSTYYFFYPFDPSSFSIFSFNSYEDIVMEIILGFVFILALFLSNDIKKIKDFMSFLFKSTISNLKASKIMKKDYIVFFTYLGFLLFTIGQFFVFLLLNRGLIRNFSWYVSLFTLIWILVLLLLIFLIIPFRERKEEMKI